MLIYNVSSYTLFHLGYDIPSIHQSGLSGKYNMAGVQCVNSTPADSIHLSENELLLFERENKWNESLNSYYMNCLSPMVLCK